MVYLGISWDFMEHKWVFMGNFGFKQTYPQAIRTPKTSQRLYRKGLHGKNGAQGKHESFFYPHRKGGDKKYLLIFSNA